MLAVIAWFTALFDDELDASLVPRRANRTSR